MKKLDPVGGIGSANGNSKGKKNGASTILNAVPVNNRLQFSMVQSIGLATCYKGKEKWILYSRVRGRVSQSSQR